METMVAADALNGDAEQRPDLGVEELARPQAVARLPGVPGLHEGVWGARPGHCADRAAPHLFEEHRAACAAENGDLIAAGLNRVVHLTRWGNALHLGVADPLTRFANPPDQWRAHRRAGGVLDDHRQLDRVRDRLKIVQDFRRRKT